MILLRLYLLAGLIAHKAVWEVLRRGSESVKPPFRPIKLLKIALLAGFLLQTVLPPLLPLGPPAGFHTLLGALLFTLGLGIAITARVQLGRNWANVESATVLPGQQLVDYGLYGHIRQPIYLGDVLLVAGLELALNSWLIALLVPLAAYVWKKAAQEEQLLSKNLPGYSSYINRSARFIPRTAAVGMAAGTIAFAIQFTLVQVNYGGDWSGLFLTSSGQQLPSELVEEKIHLFPNSGGYDSQFYHMLAHDPLMTGATARYVDAPRLRYPRILLPASAYLLALGQKHWIDPALYTLSLLCFGFGAWWLARFAELKGLDCRWGLAFLLLPAAVISLDRLTVDLLSLALGCAFCLYATQNSHSKVYWVLVLTTLTRETGLLLWGSYGLFLLSRRDWARAFRFGTAVIPMALWTALVFLRLPASNSRADSHFLARPDDAGFLFSSFIHRFFIQVEYSLPPPMAAMAIGLDYLSLTGTLLATILGVRWFLQHPTAPLRITAAVFAAFPFLIGGVVGWYDPFGFPRTLTLLFLLSLIAAIESKNWRYAIPVAMLLPRIGMQLAPRIPGIRQFLQY